MCNVSCISVAYPQAPSLAVAIFFARSPSSVVCVVCTDWVYILVCACFVGDKLFEFAFIKPNELVEELRVWEKNGK